MKEFLWKTITTTLFILCLTSYCNGEKGADNSSLLLLLSPQQSSGVNGLTNSDIAADSDAQVVSNFEDLNVNQGEPDLVLFDPNLKAWIDPADNNQCFFHFTLKVKIEEMAFSIRIPNLHRLSNQNPT